MRKKTISIVLSLVLLLSLCCFALFACNKEEEEEVKLLHTDGAVYADASYFQSKHNKAMILIPGLMASSLHTTKTDEYFETNTQVWGVQGFINLVSVAAPDDSTFRASALMNLLGSDENGTPHTKLRVDDMRDADAYGSFQGMSYLYDLLSPLYGEQYDIIVWQYDWRETNVGSAEQLELFINAKGWDEVMFFTHSMGGIVTANYLARSAANREKTTLFMPFGAPFLGSMDAIPNLFVDTVTTGGGFELAGAEVDLFGLLTEMMSEGTEKFTMATLARTVTPVYEMLPTDAFNASPFFSADSGTVSAQVKDADGNVTKTINYINYVGADSSILLSGRSATMAEYLSFIASFNWAKRADGTSIAAVANQTSYVSSLLIDNGSGNKVFVTELVPTEYMLGIGMETSISADINAAGEITAYKKSMLGDGTVPAYSATAGHSLNDENVHFVVGVSHGPLANDSALDGNTADVTCLKFVPNIMKKYIEKTDSELGLK